MSARRLVGLSSIGLLLAAFATRVGQSLGYDELFTVWVASRPLADLIHQANVDGFTPPAFYLLVKLFALTGLSNEGLRVVPVVFGGLAACFGLLASERLFGARARWPAICLIPGSAYLFTFAHELRPYSALLCCAFFFLGQMGGTTDERSDVRAAIAALIATAFSYLGLSLVAIWLFECRRRCARARLALVGLLALLLCAPGLLKASTLATANVASRITWSAPPPALSTVIFGLAPVPFDARVEFTSLVLLTALLLSSRYPLASPVLSFLCRAFVVFTVSVFVLDAMVPIGFAPRYFAISVAALLLLLVGVLSRLRRAGLPVAVALLAVNGVATFRYLSVQPAAREDWRGAMSRIEGRLGPDGVLLAFPFHHAAAAAHAYAPRVAVGGGYTARGGPLLWYPPPASFHGYSFSGLTKVDDPADMWRGLTGAPTLCLLSDEPDPRKTAALFEAFAAFGGEPFDTGDPRLRALCRPPG